ncbi:excalibur calcium-binding domain-containing protein [Nocardia sp. 2]|uniref:Excalibur calcium-binding domain-containing protein n=1 Tax=Nocardia acididurans TaxID=2802282 RepID=A0ABS1M1G9_9NOCA|nr:excalibur calcium-binding domain-containing protein [Nocardia acididurans]
MGKFVLEEKEHRTQVKKTLTFLGVIALLLAALVLGAKSASAEEVYYKNCAAARDAGAAPILRGEPGYRPALDRDNDGIACE